MKSTNDTDLLGWVFSTANHEKMINTADEEEKHIEAAHCGRPELGEKPKLA